MSFNQTITSSAWVKVAVTGVLCFAFLPYISVLLDGFSFKHLSQPYWGALTRSIKQGALTFVLAVSVGWPLGTLVGLAKLPGRRLLICFLAVPILTPTFLWAIGISSLQSFFAYKWRFLFDGLPGAVWSSAAQAFPCVVLGAILGTISIPASIRDATRLAVGTRGLFRTACFYNLPITMCAGLFAVMLGLTDPGVSQIMGYHGIATEILIALGSQSNFAMACSKSVVFAVLLALVAAPVLWVVSERFALEFVGRNPTASGSVNLGRKEILVSSMFLLILSLISLPPLIGLFRPLLGANLTEPLEFFIAALKQAGPTTMAVALTAAITATALGALIGMLGRGRFSATRSLLFVAMLYLLLPTSLHALGVSKWFTGLPAFFDPVTRGSILGLGMCLGVKLLPVSILLFSYATNQRSVSQDNAAAIHGVPVARYFCKVWIPQMSSTFLASMVLVGLLASTDVAGTLTLQPAGRATLATRLFSVLDNASERSLAVWSLGFMVFVAMTGLVMFSCWKLLRRMAGKENA